MLKGELWTEDSSTFTLGMDSACVKILRYRGHCKMCEPIDASSCMKMRLLVQEGISHQCSYGHLAYIYPVQEKFVSTAVKAPHRTTAHATGEPIRIHGMNVSFRAY